MPYFFASVVLPPPFSQLDDRSDANAKNEVLCNQFYFRASLRAFSSFWFMRLLYNTIPTVTKTAATIQPMHTKIDHADPSANIVPKLYTMEEVIMDTTTQNKSVHLNLPFPISPFAAATAAKQGIVNILKAINAIKAGI